MAPSADEQLRSETDGKTCPQKENAKGNLDINSPMEDIEKQAAYEETAASDGKANSLYAQYTKPIVLFISAIILIVCMSIDLDPERPDAAKGAAVLAIVALWWVTEVVPLTVTAFLPMVLYPALSIIPASTLAKEFFNGTTFLFVAGFLLGIALERWNMHRRVAYSIVSSMGCRTELLLGGFMISVWLLSMWISNTAAILCMLPVAQAFLQTLPPATEAFQKSFLLAMGYSATIGGIATPVGTPTNGIFMGLYSQFWPEEDDFSFARFVAAAFPLSALLLFIVWLGMCTMYVWRNSVKIVLDPTSFQSRRASLGKWQFEEFVLVIGFSVLVLLWFTAAPIGEFRGWKQSVAADLNTGSIGLAITLPFFFIPCGSRLPRSLRRFLGNDRCQSLAVDTKPKPEYILDWDAAKSKFHWEILFVFGSGYLLAKGTLESQLADLIATALANIDISQLGFIMLVTCVTAFITEFVSNMATTNIFGTIVVATAQKKDFDPVLILLVVTLASSFAFMLPTAGGPNMCVYSTGKVSIRFMATHGIALNVVAIVLGGLYMGIAMPEILGDNTSLPVPAIGGLLT
jgi:sodium-dependent dicarboxylate transporter 2/3/5